MTFFFCVTTQLMGSFCLQFLMSSSWTWKLRPWTWPLGSGLRYKILSHVFVRCLSQTTNCHARITHISPAIFAWQCVVWLAQHTKMCDTNHIPRATAFNKFHNWCRGMWSWQTGQDCLRNLTCQPDPNWGNLESNGTPCQWLSESVRVPGQQAS